MLLLLALACTPDDSGSPKGETGDADADADTDTDTDTDSDTHTDSATDTGDPDTGDSGGPDSGDSGEPEPAELMVIPESLDFPLAFVGQTVAEILDLYNLGPGHAEVSLVLTGVHADQWRASPDTSALDAGESRAHILSVIPENYGDYAVELSFTADNLLEPLVVPVTLTVQVDDDGDGIGSLASGGEDCDDNDPSAYPGALETWYDSVDSDCSGGSDYDYDGDLVAYPADCDDNDASIFPGAAETWYDGVDQDCAGDDDFDQDADGFLVDEECDDTDGSTFPGAPDAWYDGLDADCAGDNDYDQDLDGEEVTTDCNDTDATVYTGAPDTWYDGVDSNCDGADDFDQDADGDPYGSDCDDTDATRSTLLAETWYDGLDADCDGADDDDQDKDGDPYGSDCDDTDATRSTLLAETWYDGVDSDCAGDNDDDQDADGIEVNDDCDDTDATVGEPTAETRDDVDNDCNGLADDLAIEDYAGAVLDGPTSIWAIGQDGGFAIGGDMDNDGETDIVVTSAELSTGHAWWASGDSFYDGTYTLTSVDYADAYGGSYDYPVAHVLHTGADLTGDGIDDTLVAATDQGSEEGTVYLVSGGSSLTGNFWVGTKSAATFEGDDNDDELTWATTADIDGDGSADIVIAAPLDNRGGSYGRGGTVAIFEGGSAFSGSYDLDDADGVLCGDSSDDQLGRSIALGDSNGDGYDDILAGSPNRNGSGSVYDAGAIFLFQGNASLSWGYKASTSAAFEITGVGVEEHLGRSSLASPADYDGDGDGDLVVASPANDEVYAWWAGSLSGTETTATADVTITGSGDFGASLSSQTDLDGDGVPDLAVGAPEYDTPDIEAGAVFLFAGATWAATLTEADAGESYLGTDSGHHLGAGLSGGADVDGDGNDDLAMGAPGLDGSYTGAGGIYVVPGR